MALILAQPVSAQLSDDFNQCTLDTGLWTAVDPVGDATFEVVGGGSGAAALRISVPAGTEHLPYLANDAARLIQPVADADLEVELRFESAPSLRYQLQGLIVEESPTRYLRFEFYSNGATLNALVMAVEDGVARTLESRVLAESPELMRIGRVGDEWTFEWAPASGIYQTFATFSEPLAVTGLGPYAGNYGGSGIAPAHTAVVDYVFSTTSPITPEDAPTPGAPTLTLTATAGGSATADPQQAAYACSEAVDLTATPEVGFEFLAWTGDLTSTDNPAQITMDASYDVVAHFGAVGVGPVISNLGLFPGEDTVTVTWQTDVPATSAVDVGTTTSYELGTVSTSTPRLDHMLVFPSLTPETDYFLRVRSSTPTGSEIASGDLPFTTLAMLYPNGAHPNGLRSDEFNTCALDTTVWQIVDPIADGSASIVGAGSGNSRLYLSVPAGTEHSPWVADTALQAMQSAADADFELEAKFDSVPSLQYQEQGILVREAPGRFLRFEVYSTNTEQIILGAAIADGVGTILIQQPVTVTPGYRLRVGRVGDRFTLSYSNDGSIWTQAGFFDYTMNVGSVGVHAGNEGTSPPSHIAIVDYFVNREVDLAGNDDSAPVPPTVLLTTNVVGFGAVSVNPPGPSFACGDQVDLAALPDPGFEFVDWSGDVSGVSPGLQFAIVRDLEVTATFQPDSLAPVISIDRVIGGPDGAEVWVSTNEPASISVAYGPTAAYETGVVSSLAGATAFVAQLPGLAGNAEFHFEVTATDASTNSTSSGDQTAFTSVALGAGAAGIVSDDFNSCAIDTGIWSVIDPLADATFAISGAGGGDARLEISVPGGTAHFPGAINTAPRLMQPVLDADTEIEVRFDSQVLAQFVEQGVIVEEAPGTYLRFDFYGNGSGTELFAASYDAGGATTYGNVSVSPPADTSYMRITRVGNTWTQSYSFDGVSWTVATSFDYVMTMGSVGVFAGNEPNNSSPPHTAVVDYFWTTQAPAVPEDFGSVGGVKTLSLFTSGPGTITADPDQTEFACGEAVELTAVPDPGYAFDAWSGDLTGAENPDVIAMTDSRSVTASFILDTVPPVISNVQVFRTQDSAIVTWDTNEPATSVVDFGETTGYELGTVLDGTLTKSHSVLVPALDPGLTYFFQVTSVDGATLSSSVGGIESGPPQGPTIDLWYGNDQSFGQNGLPQPWVNILGNVSDPDGVVSLSYTLNGGAPRALSLGPDDRRLADPGDFNADIAVSDLQPGLNTVILTAVDGIGNPNAAVVNLDFDDTTIAPLPFGIDWGTLTGIQDAAQAVDGNWEIQGGTVRSLQMDYDRLLAMGDLSWTDYEMTVPITVDSIDPGGFVAPSNQPGVGIMLRWPGHSIRNANQPADGFLPLGAIGFLVWKEIGTTRLEIYANSGANGITLDFPFGVTHMFKMRVETIPGVGGLYSLKVWPQGDPEPPTWTLTRQEGLGDPQQGSPVLVAHHVDATFGTVTITPLP